MKFIEQQLLAALRDTPMETDLTVSVRLLEILGQKGEIKQREWLEQNRASHAGKDWQMTGEHWEYGLLETIAPRGGETGYVSPRAVSSPPTTIPRRVIVKPLAPLAGRRLG